jgi:hypothetical protein
MSKTLRFWVRCEYDRGQDERHDRTKSELLSGILHDFEKAGDAMRYLTPDGRVAWKTTPRMLARLADAEHEPRDDLADSMLIFYVNRAGKNLSAARRKTLERSKVELRKLFGKDD